MTLCAGIKRNLNCRGYVDVEHLTYVSIAVTVTVLNEIVCEITL